MTLQTSHIYIFSFVFVFCSFVFPVTYLLSAQFPILGMFQFFHVFNLMYIREKKKAVDGKKGRNDSESGLVVNQITQKV